MKIYLTRHGQVLPAEFFESVDNPTGDIPLSPLGEKQAVCLGEELKRRGFCGPILFSPYLRTATTANIAAEVCGAKTYPEPVLREKVYSEEEMNRFCGQTLAQLKARFAAVAEDAALDHPWWTTQVEDDLASVAARVEPLLERLIAAQAPETLLVGHGASVMSAVYYFRRKFGVDRPEGLHNVNCSLCCFELNGKGELVRAELFANDHLPEDYLTSNTAQKERFEPYIEEREE